MKTIRRSINNKRCSKLDRMKNEVIREKLQLFNLNEKLKDYKKNAAKEC